MNTIIKASIGVGLAGIFAGLVFIAVDNTAEPGDLMPDGSIYAGSTSDNQGLYATYRGGPTNADFEDAAKYCETLTTHRREDWTLPSSAQLDLLYARQDVGNLDSRLNANHAFKKSWYWAAQEKGEDGTPKAKLKDFGTGKDQWVSLAGDADSSAEGSVYCVRTGPLPD